MQGASQQRKKTTCSGCLQTILDKTFISCASHKCLKKFHLLCANAVELTQEQLKIWICPECIANTKRGGDNTRTPIRQSENITIRKNTKSSKVSTPPEASTECQDILVEIRLLRQNMINMQNAFSERLDKLTEKLSSYESRIQEIEQENMELKAHASELQDQLNKYSCQSLQTDIKILGLTELPNENPYHLVLTTANKIGVELDDRDLSYTSRSGRGSREAVNSGHLPRPLIVSFTRRTKREEFIKQAKARRTLESKDIVGSGAIRKIYINERMTSNCRRLFRTCRLWAKEHGFKYCWVRNGNIYIMKEEARNGSPPIRVRAPEDLENLLNKQVGC